MNYFFAFLRLNLFKIQHLILLNNIKLKIQACPILQLIAILLVQNLVL